MIDYNTIFIALRLPDAAWGVETPSSPQEWQRFFGMMERLERAQIVTYTKGRYELHPHQHERIRHWTERVLDSMSLSLELPESLEETSTDLGDVIYSREADAVSLYDEIQRLRENEAALRYAVQCSLDWFRGDSTYSRQTMVVFLEQFEEADRAVADAMDAAVHTKQCETCGGYGFTRDDAPTEAVDPYLLPTEEFEAVAVEEQLYAHTRHLETQELPAVVSAPAMTVVEAAEALETVATKIADSPSDEWPPKAYVRINTTGRGLSSGSYEVLCQVEKYGRSWLAVYFGTDVRRLVHHFPAERCQLVDAPQAKPALSTVERLLDGLPIAQAVATYGVEDTKAALNLVAERVIEQAVTDAMPQLLTEGV